MNNFRQTSMEAYHSNLESLGKNQFKVLQVLSKSKAPLCNKQIAEILDKPINTITPRVNELIKKGLVKYDSTNLYNGRNVRFNRVAEIDEAPDNVYVSYKEKYEVLCKDYDALKYLYDKLIEPEIKELKEWI
ncbi:MAG: winged helix-turn-helix domain-containing protein [Aureibaculum sp.]|nr:winged helix-turn-helix domain-containing protein [Aureibaculum sp.]